MNFAIKVQVVNLKIINFRKEKVENLMKSIK